jgi:hypothetical protein
MSNQVQAPFHTRPSAWLRRLSTCAAALGLLAASGCASFKLKNPPSGFIEVSSSKYSGEAELRMKAPDNVGLNITTFSNRRGGNLALWSDDMVKKLQDRGYVLERQSPVKSGNGVEGTRFDFAYEPPGSDDGEKFYTAVLFVTDHWRVVVQLAGKDELASGHAGDLEKILAKIKVRGCKVASKVCNSGQPRTFEATHEPKPNSSGEAKPEGEAKTKTEAEAPAEGDKDKPEADAPAEGDKDKPEGASQP